jgi:RNA polymerase sigma factor (sigma-70 family)
VQETWLRALTKPARASFSPRAWLAGLLKNVAREQRRAESRRERREGRAPSAAATAHATSIPGFATTPSRDDDPATLAERFDLVRRLLAWIDDLPSEPRRALLQRYLDGLEPAEIARRDGVNDATVRSRIKRGLDELRSRLDVEHGGERTKWMGVLLPWTLPAARIAARTTAAGTGGIAVKVTSATIATAALLVLGFGVVVRAWWREEPALGSPRVASRSIDAVDRTLPKPVAREEAARSPLLRDEPRPTPTPGSVAAEGSVAASASADHEWRLTGVLEGFDPAIPWTGSLLVTSVAGDLSAESSRHFDAVVAQDGSFTVALPGLAPPAKERWRGLKVVASDPAYVDTEGFIETLDEHGAPFPGPHTFEARLRTWPASLLHGRVVDEEGRPLPGMFVTKEWDDREQQYSASTDPRGEYHMAASLEGNVQLRCAGREPTIREDVTPIPAVGDAFLPAETEVELRAGVDVEAPDLVMKRSEVAIEGFVVGGNGERVRGAIVRAYGDLPSGIGDAARAPVRIGRETKCDGSGAFRLRGLVAGTWHLRVAGIEGLRAHCVVQNADDFGVADIVAPAEGVVLASRLSRIELRMHLRGQPVPKLGMMIEGTWNHSTSVMGARTDDDGRFVFLGLPGCEYRAGVDRDDVERITPPFALATDELDRVVTLDLEPKRPRASLVVKLHPSNGEPIGRAWFELMPVDASEPEGISTGSGANSREFRIEGQPDGSDSVFCIPEIEPGDYRVRVRPGGGYYGCGGSFQEESFEVDLSEPAIVTRAIAVRPTGRLRLFAKDEKGEGLRARCKVRDSEGRELACVFACEAAQTAKSSSDQTFEDSPAFVTPPPAPGRYSIELAADGRAPKTIEAEVKPGKTTDVTVVLAR